MFANQEILTTALSLGGTREVRGAAANPTIVDMFRAAGSSNTSDETAWCAAAACYVLEELALPNPKTVRARTFLDLERVPPSDAELITSVGDLEPGDLVVLWRGHPLGNTGHVGVFLCRHSEAATADLWLHCGNQGDGFAPARYPVGQFLGARRYFKRSLGQHIEPRPSEYTAAQIREAQAKAIPLEHTLIPPANMTVDQVKAMIDQAARTVAGKLEDRLRQEFEEPEPLVEIPHEASEPEPTELGASDDDSDTAALAVALDCDPPPPIGLVDEVAGE